MDAAALSTLLSQSTDRLASLHAEIGHPADALQDALELLHQALKNAVDGQIAKVQQEAEGLKAECGAIQDDIARIQSALGDQPSAKTSTSTPAQQGVAAGRRIFSTSSLSGSGSPVTDAAELQKLPLLQRKSQLASDRQRLRALYTTKETHVDRLLNKLDSYRPLLGSFVKAPSRLQSAATAQAASGVVTAAASECELKDVSHARITAVEGEILRCSKELNQRIERLNNGLQDIVRLWTELALEPCQPLDLGDEALFEDGKQTEDLDCGGAAVSFDRAVLAHLQLRPLYNEEGRFEGEFASTEGEEQDDDGEEGDRTARDINILESTPTRASFGGRPARQGGKLAFRLPSRIGPATSAVLAIPDHQMEPSETNLDLTARRIGWLEAEKHRREALIQNLYDELAELWAKFDVPEEEMDAFVMDHRGSTLEVIEAYESELDKMRSLKAQHMSLFILKTRERIATLWDSLFLTPEEREASFPPFFIDISPEASDPDDLLPTDEILAAHEQMIDRLTEQVCVKAPVLKVIGRYKELLEDERQLAESAADGARLLGRGSRGDPGRLLREEKMRKRVKVQKPRIEAELQKVIPAWEEEHGEPFTINGVRYLDELLGRIGGPKDQLQRKRARPPSAAPTPQARGGAASGRTPSQRSGVAQTPMRPITLSLSTAKKSKTGEAPSTGTGVRSARSTAGPPTRQSSTRLASSSVRQPPATVERPGTSISSHRDFSGQSNVPSSPSRIPLPSSPPKASSRNFTAQSADSGYGSRNVTGTSVPSKVVVVAMVPRRESFRPRPSGNLRTYKASVPVGDADAEASDASRPQQGPMSPGRMSKWGEMGPPRWPAAQAAAEGAPVSGRIASSVSIATSVHSDRTTLIHPRATADSDESASARRDPAKKYRRAPSMSLETCLAHLAASSAASAASASRRRLGDGLVDDGICSIRSISSSNSIAELADEGIDGGAGGEGERTSRIHGWKDGLRFAGAAPETENETDEDPSEAEEPRLPRSGSNNWSVVDEDDELDRYHCDQSMNDGIATAAAAVT
nr:putative microtubule associated protein [Thecaphora frezii]